MRRTSTAAPFTTTMPTRGTDRARDCRAADRNLEQRAAKQTGAGTLPAAGSGAGISGGQPRDCQDAGKRARRTVADGRAVCRHQRAVFGSAAVWRAAQVRQPVLCSGTAGDADQLGGGRNEDGARRDGTHHGADDGQPKPDSDEPIRFHTIE